MELVEYVLGGIEADQPQARVVEIEDGIHRDAHRGGEEHDMNDANENASSRPSRAKIAASMPPIPSGVSANVRACFRATRKPVSSARACRRTGPPTVRMPR